MSYITRIGAVVELSHRGLNPKVNPFRGRVLRFTGDSAICQNLDSPPNTNYRPLCTWRLSDLRQVSL